MKKKIKRQIAYYKGYVEHLKSEGGGKSLKMEIECYECVINDLKQLLK